MVWEISLKKRDVAKILAFSLGFLLAFNSGLIWETAVKGQSSQTTFGNNIAGNSLIYFYNYKAASKFQLTEQGIVQSVTVYFESYLYYAKAAVYADSNGTPGILIAQSGSEEIRSNGWHEFALPPTMLAQGYYWLNVVSDSIKAIGRSVNSEIPNQSCMRTDYYPSEFTSPFGPNPWYYSMSISMYAAYIPATQPTPTPAPSPTPTPSPPPSSSSTFGITIVGNSDMYFSEYKVASRFQLTESSTVQSIIVYFVSSGFDAKAAIYADDDGKPQTLLTTSSTEDISINGWHEFALTPTQLTPGYYWLSAVSNSTKAKGKIVNTGIPNQACIRQAYYPYEFTSSFGTEPWYYSISLSMYPTYIPTTQPTPTPQLSWGLYWDQACTNEVASVVWGNVSPSATNTIVLYVRNEGNIPITLGKAMSNWEPSNAAMYIGLDWDYTYQSLSQAPR